MTNLQGGPSARIRREWCLLGLPVAVGALLSLGVVAAVLWPSWQQLQLAQQELDQLEEQRQRIPLLRAQLLKLSDNVQEAEERSRQILGLIAGSGEISTFMAQLSAEAQRSGVVLDGYEPITTTALEAEAPSPKPKPSKGEPPPPPPDPLLVPGLQKTSLLLIARGTGPQLLDFLRRLEQLSLLVVQSDLSLKHELKEAGKPGEAPANTTNLRLNLSVYSEAEQPRKTP
jgi:type IV pilus assembly protein PilO